MTGLLLAPLTLEELSARGDRAWNVLAAVAAAMGADLAAGHSPSPYYLGRIVEVSAEHREVVEAIRVRVPADGATR